MRLPGIRLGTCTCPAVTLSRVHAGASERSAGVLLVDKAGGRTSHDVVSTARRRLGTRRVGHAGTLDPMATGLLILGFGPATRLLTYLVGLDKTYEATIRLGQGSSTDDADGELLVAAPPRFADDALAAAVAGLTGPIQQRPSSVSAIKVGGKRAHALARAGEVVELAPRPVTIHEFAVLGVDRDPDGAAAGGVPDAVEVVDVAVRVSCSSGTYIRALARDLGTELGTAGHLTRLRRTRVGPFRVEDAAPVEDAAVLAPAEVASALFPVARLDPQQARALANGIRTALAVPDAPVVAAIAPDGELLGLVEVTGGIARVLANFPLAPEPAPHDEERGP